MRSQSAQDNAVWAALIAAVMLAYAYLMGTRGISSSSIFNAAVLVFNWTLWLGGFAFLLVAAIGFCGFRGSLLISSVVSAICGLAFVGSNLCRLALGSPRVLNYWIALVFGCLLLKSAHTAWSWYRADAAGAGDRSRSEADADSARHWLRRRQVPSSPPSNEPPHPASFRPTGLPADGSPPPGGYLAALAREEDPPPNP